MIKKREKRILNAFTVDWFYFKFVKSLESRILSGEFDANPIQALNLDAYQRTVTRITSARGRHIRRLVNDTFLRFFSGATLELEWENTAAQILGN